MTRGLERALGKVPPLHRLARNVGSPASRGHRFQAAWRTVHFDVRTRILKRPTVAPLGHHSRIIAYPGETNSPHAAYRNPPNPREMYAWRRYLRPDDLFVDVGANIGIYTIFALDLGARVIACEPDPHNFLRLQEHVALNGYDAELLNVAVADEPGTVRLTQGLDSYNYLVRDGGAGIDVPATTLDEIIGDRRVAGVKIDVEGAERLVLQGAARALAEQRIELVQVEWSTDLTERTLGGTRHELAEIFSGAGYHAHRPDTSGVLHHVGDDPEPGRRDVFMAPRILGA
jgi:FkbM family methyltransferase